MLKSLIPQKKTPDYWLEVYKEQGALFIHDNNHLRPHPVLRSGRHSNGFFNSDILLQDPTLIDEMSWHLLNSFHDFGLDTKIPDRTVGPAMGAITLAHHLAFKISTRARKCLTSYAAKHTIDDSEVHIFNRNPPQIGESVLLVEDVITSGGSIEKTAVAVRDSGATVLPYIVCLVNRSGKTKINGRKVISLVGSEIEGLIKTWEPEDCEQCIWMSPPLADVKKVENWRRLTQE